MEPIVVVHGGAAEWYAGTEAGRAACRRAAQAGYEALAAGGGALDAVVAAVRVVEDDPACNAGTGAVLTSRGTLELDACVMDGTSLASGAVAVLPAFRHPVDVARAVLEDGRYHLLVGDGAAAFARARGFVACDPELMITPDRRAQLEGRGSSSAATPSAPSRATPTAGSPPRRAPAGSPGPTRGASATRHSSAAERTRTRTRRARAPATARRTRGRARLLDGRERRRGAQATAERSVARVLERFGGYGGLILIDRDGEIGIARSASAMPHAVARSDGSVTDGE